MLNLTQQVMASIFKEAYNYYSGIISKEVALLQRCPMDGYTVKGLPES